MPSIAGYADSAIESYPDLASLPDDAAALLERADGLFGSRLWWELTLAHALPKQGVPSFAVLRSKGRSRGLVPLLRLGNRLHGLTTPYTCVFSPALAEADTAALAALARVCRAMPVTRLDCLPADAPWVRRLPAAAARAGLRTLPFDHFGNWSEDVAGLDWQSYLSRRPGALRETIRRRLRKAEAMAEAHFELLTRPQETERAIAAYEFVYARSWKKPEPYPAFNPALIRATAAAGWLRMGIWWIGETPIAVQCWVVTNGHATVLKLAHDETFKAHSPGTVLTALMLRHLLAHELVARIDFGRGDDSYKQGWTSERRQRIGLLLVDPLCPAGLATWTQHAMGRAWRYVRGAKPQ